MQSTNHFLRAAYQVGPWRITRKVLLFVIVFCVVIVGFGTLIFKTHMLDGDWEDMEWDDDDDWEDNISGGDSVLLILIGLAVLAALISCGGCFMASFNAPEQLNDTSSVFTLSGVRTAPPTTASAPQAVTRQQLQQQQPRQQRRPRRVEEVKSYPPTSEYPQGPSYPENPGYPPHPPPYSAPGYPPTGGVPPPGAPPPPHTVADLPPPYTPGHYQSNARY